MTDHTPDVASAPLQLADIEWSTRVAVSMKVIGAPGIPAPCGHLLQPFAFIASFRRGSIPTLSQEWEVDEWEILVTHPDEGGLGVMELTLKPEHFGEGIGDLPLPSGLDIPAGFQGMAEMLGLMPKVELLGPVPEWVTTAVQSYMPFRPLKGAPVRVEATYHG